MQCEFCGKLSPKEIGVVRKNNLLYLSCRSCTVEKEDRIIVELTTEKWYSDWIQYVQDATRKIMKEYNLTAQDGESLIDKIIQATMSYGASFEYKGGASLSFDLEDFAQSSSYNVAYVTGPTKTSYDKARVVVTGEKYALKGCAIHVPFTYKGGSPEAIDTQRRFAILRRCDTLILAEGWEESETAMQEHEMAQLLGKRVVYDKNKKDKED